MPIVIEAVPALLALAALIVALGMIRFGTVIVSALFLIPNTVLGYVPWLGGKAKAPIHKIEQRLNSALASAAAGVELSIGKTWHALAYIVEQTGQVLIEAVRATAHIAWLVEVKYPLRALHYAATHVGARVKVIERTGTTVIREVKISRKQLGAAVAAAVAAALHAGHLVITQHTDPFNLRAKIGHTWKQLRHLWARVSRLERITAGLGAVALVATALERMGLKWLRCPSLSRVGRKIGCGGFGIIEEFLAPAFEAILVVDICRFARLSQALAHEVSPALAVTLLTQEAFCFAGGESLPSAHDTPRLHLTVTRASAIG